MPVDDRLLRIGVLITPNDPFWVQVGQFVAEELGPRLVWIDGEDIEWGMNPEDLADFLDELLALELDAFISLNLPEQFLKQLMDHRIAVVSLDEAYPEYPGFPSSFSWESTGRIIGEYLATKLNGIGKIFCIMGEIGEMDYNASRIAGLKTALAPYPDITIEYISTYWAFEKAVEDLEEQFRCLVTMPDVIFGLSDSIALAGRDAARKLGLLTDKTLVVGINGDPLALAAIAEGSMAASVHVMTKEFARQAALLAIDGALGKPLPHYFHFYPLLVTQENVNQVANQKLMDIAMIPSKLVGLNRQADQSRLKQLEISLTLSQKMGSILDRRRLLKEITGLISSNYEYDEVYFFEWQEAEQQFVLESPELVPQFFNCIPVQTAGLLAEALQQGKPIFILDALESRRYPVDNNCPEVKSRGVIPVPYGGKILGMLDLRGKHPVRVRRLELMGLQVLAEQLGFAIRNAELYTEAVEARQAAEKADQLKTRLLANVSHELRAPLNVILGYTRAALNSPNPYQIELPPELRIDLERVFNSGEHLIRLINDLLDLSRAEIGELELFPETIASRAFLEEIFQSMAALDSEIKDISWELRLPERLPVIQADPVRLRQVILNLLSNARKFILKGKIILGAEIDPPNLHIWVEDTGPGIPYDQQELIFQPFVTIERNTRRREGIGLGLSVTRRLVSLHGGTITLESSPGKGSTFHVYLPLPSLSGQAPLINAPNSKPGLLLISGTIEISRMVQDLVERLNWEIVRINFNEDIEETLNHHQPAALLWDVSQRTSKDWAVIQRLCSHPKSAHLPILVYGLESIDHNLSVGSLTGLMPKPFNYRRLVDTLNALCPAEVPGSILIVDDDSLSRKLYVDLAQRALPGCQVIEAEDGAAALNILESEMPSLVLLDLVMPGVDGFTVLEHIRTHPSTRHLPVMIISGKVLSTEDIERLDFAHVAVQSKQILTPEELEDRLRNVFEENDLLPQPTSRVVKLAISHIHQYYQQALSRRTLADSVGVTESYLSKIFHQEVGISPWEYLTRFRVNRAKELLTTSKDTITLLASQVGFEDPAYFSRVFHKYTGLAPLAWRKRARF